MKQINQIAVALVWVAVSLFATACANKDSLIQTGYTDDYTQDLNPPYVDVLWMINDKSPMSSALPKLKPEATDFFKRLDAASQSYRMAFASADMEVHPAVLRPVDAPAVLTKESTSNNSVDDRAAYFSSILGRYINLSTGAKELGLSSVKAILETKFVPRANVPLVVIFVSDSYDAESMTAGVNKVDYYEAALLAMKGGNRKLIRVYSVNYKYMPSGQNNETRCATRYNADADVVGAVNAYHELAKRFAVDTANPDQATGVLCQPFSSNIDITGLKMKDPAVRFALKKTPKLDTLKVSVFKRGTDELYDIKWSYDATTNEIVFVSAPPEGSNIRINYFPG